MKAILQRSFGGAEVLKLEDLPDPHPATGEVRIRVASAGVHFADTVNRRGIKAGPGPHPILPFIPGREVAGIIDEVAHDVDRSWIGRRVVTHLSQECGGYAEFALADFKSLHQISPNLEFDEAVTMVGTGRTALAVLETAEPRDDDVVIVTASAGGIGSLLIQGLRESAKTVVALAGGIEKVTFLRSLGVPYVVDYSTDGWVDAASAILGPQKASLVLDGVGGTIGRQTLQLLGVRGRLVMFGSSSGNLIELSSKDFFERGISAVSAIGARLINRAGGLHSLESLAIEAVTIGKLKPVIGGKLPLSEAATAHTLLESRESRGKVVLNP